MGKEKSVQETFKEVLDMLDEAKHAQEHPRELDYETVIRDVERAIEEIDSDLARLEKKTGMTKEQLEAYTADERNFTPEEWKMLQEIRGQIAQLEVTKEGAEGVVEHVTPKKTKSRKHWKQA